MGIETALAVGGGALLGGLAGSQKQGGGTTTTTSTSAPWEPQQPYITYGFEQAKDLYQKAAQNPVYQGQRVADLNPFTTNISNIAGNFAPQGFTFGQNVLNQGQNVANIGANFAGNAGNLFNLYSNPNGAMDLGNSYANSGVAQGLIDASSRDVTRNLYENQLPTLAKAAAGSGNTNSTRAGVESAIAQRGAADRLADISSGVRNQFFNQGVNQFNQNLQNSLAANSQLYNAYNTGTNNLAVGQNLANNAFNMGTAAGDVFQTQQQKQLDAEAQKFNETQNNPLDLLAKYKALIDGNYGGTSTGSSTAPTYGGGWMGALNGALGGATAGVGLAGKLGYLPKP